jgi:hypothetical protein
MSSADLTRSDLFGKRFETPLWVVGVLGSIGLFLYGLFGCQWLNQRDPAFTRLLFSAYVVSAAFLFVRRRSFFPWSQKAPILAFLSGVAMAAVFGMAVSGIVLVSNAVLDRGMPTTRRYRVVGKMDPADAVLASMDSSGPAAVNLHVGRSGWSLAPGNTVDLIIKPGFLHKPWIKGYRR